eukprot:TRINITY_DN183_c0_g1_i5.p1 TRINITY_DN183_c0_g1~~TRINITY_DN183_c0_g1_i5.p1  ORF type:complete len:717 (+),score=192.57 TRINITY_DN183_c0_g1_i5:54-2153(+)
MEVDGAPKKKEKQLPAEPNTSPDCPCAHNDWDNVRVKKGFITLRCRQCQAQWKTEMGSVKKCFKFFQGMCRRGAACPLPHIHRYKQSLEKRQTIFGENLDEDPPSVPATPDKRRRHKKSPSPATSHASSPRNATMASTVQAHFPAALPSPATSHASSPRNATMASTVQAHFPATNHLAPHHGYMGGVPVLHVQSPDHSQMSLGGLHPLALADAQLHNAPAPEEMRRESGASIWSASSMMWSEPGLTCDGSLASSPPMSPSNRRHKLAARSLAPIHVPSTHYLQQQHPQVHEGYMGGVPMPPPQPCSVPSPETHVSIMGCHHIALPDQRVQMAPPTPAATGGGTAQLESTKSAASINRVLHAVVNEDGTTDVASNAGDEEDAPGLGHVMTEREVDEMNASFGSCGSCAQRYIPTRRAEKQAEADRSLNDLCSYPSNSSGLLTPAHVPLHHPDQRLTPAATGGRTAQLESTKSAASINRVLHAVVNEDGTTDVASNAGDEEDAPGLGHVMTEREVDEMNASFDSCAQRYIPTKRAEKQAAADRSLNDLCSYPSNSSGLLTPAHVPLHHPGPGPLPGTGIYSLTPVTQPMAPAGQPPPMMASPPPQVPLPGPAAPLTHLHPTASGAPPSPYYGNAPSPHGHHVSLQHLHSPGNVSPCHMPPQPQTQVNVSPMAQQPMPVAGPVSPPPRRQGQYQPYALDATS